jgi:hypothetical protein
MGSLGGSNPSGKSYKSGKKPLPQSTTDKMKSAYRGKR